MRQIGAVVLLFVCALGPAAEASRFVSMGLGRQALSTGPFERYVSAGYKTEGEAQFKVEGAHGSTTRTQPLHLLYKRGGWI